jgi:hypothetical protein
MARLITELTAAGALDGTELAWVEQGGAARKATTQDIADLGGAGGLTDGTVTDSMLRWDGADWVEETQIRASAAGALTVYDSGLTDSSQLSHDGTDANLSFVTTSTLDVQMTGLTAGVNFSDAGNAKFYIDKISDLVEVRDGWTFRIRDSSDLDFADFSHDGTDFNLALTNTTDWNITGFASAPTSGFNVMNKVRLNGDGTVMWGSAAAHGHLTWDTGKAIVTSQTGNDLVLDAATGVVMVQDGNTFRVANSTETDYMDMSHDGTDFNFAATLTTEVVFSGASWYQFSADVKARSGLQVAGGVGTTGTDEVIAFVDVSGSTARFGGYNWGLSAWQPVLLSGSSVQVSAVTTISLDAGTDISLDTGTNGIVTLGEHTTPKFQLNNNTNTIDIRDGYLLRIKDSTDTDYGEFNHDGTDFNLSFVTTGDMNITGLTGSVNLPDLTKIIDSVATATPPTTEAVVGRIAWYDSGKQDLLADIGYVGSNTLWLRNHMHGGPMRFAVENSAGTIQDGIQIIPDGAVWQYHSGVLRTSTNSTGRFLIHSDGNTDTESRNLNLSHQDGTVRGQFGYVFSTDRLALRNLVHGGNVILSAEDTVGTARTILEGDPDGITILRGDTNLELECAAGENALIANANGSVDLYYDNVLHLSTKAYSGADDISSAEVKNYDGNLRDIGFAIMETVTKSGATAYTISETDIHKKLRVTNVTGGVTFPNDTGMAQDSVGWILNTTTSNLTLTATSNNLEIYMGDGTARSTGNFTLAGKGWCTWSKMANDTKYELVGVGLS